MISIIFLSCFVLSLAAHENCNNNPPIASKLVWDNSCANKFLTLPTELQYSILDSVFEQSPAPKKWLYLGIFDQIVNQQLDDLEQQKYVFFMIGSKEFVLGEKKNTDAEERKKHLIQAWNRQSEKIIKSIENEYRAIGIWGIAAASSVIQRLSSNAKNSLLNAMIAEWDFWRTDDFLLSKGIRFRKVTFAILINSVA